MYGNVIACICYADMAREQGMLAVACYDKGGLWQEQLSLMIFKSWIFSYTACRDKEKLNDIDIPFWMFVKAPDSLAENAWSPGLDKVTALDALFLR